LAHQLLWLQALLYAATGVPLLILPKTAIMLFGLPRSETAFWPRLAGALLTGLSLALATQGKVAGLNGISGGLGLAGIVVIDLTLAALLTVLLLLQATDAPRRGRGLLLLLIILLVCISFVAIPYTG